MRPSVDEYLMGFARHAATRATCPRKHVGAAITRDGHVLVTGYNGSIRGTEHCDTHGCLMEEGHCVRTIHAELNAILQAALNGVSVEGASLYVTASPCWPCFKHIANVGIVRVVYGEPYRAEDPGPQRVEVTAQQVGIELVGLPAAVAVRHWKLDGTHSTHALDLDSFNSPPWCTRCGSADKVLLAQPCTDLKQHYPRNGTCRGCCVCQPVFRGLRRDVHGKEKHEVCFEPQFCDCECRVCKRTWEAAGRPGPNSNP